MTELLHRVAHDVEIMRGDGRTVYGIAVPFDRESTVNDGFGPYKEVFRRGAFARSINLGAQRVKMFVNHNHRIRQTAIGVATNLREDANGLYGEFRISDTTAGNEALQLVRDGVLDSFSVGFAVPEDKSKSPRRGDVVERKEVKLREVSLVEFPAYEGAVLAGVRSLWDDEFTIEELERMLELKKTGTHASEPADGTSDGDQPPAPHDQQVGHSLWIPTRAQRIAALIQRGIPHVTL